MKKTWLVLAVLILSPLAASAHPGPLDHNSCHFCTVNCELYGLQVGDYVCHMGNDRSLNLTYPQFQTLQRHYKRISLPTLREVARIVRQNDAIRNKIYAPDKACRPTLDANGDQKAPILPKYSNLKQFGELLTAFACRNSLETVPMLNAEGNITGGLLMTLKRPATPIVKKTLRSAGFSCDNEESPLPCTKWSIEEKLISGKAMKGLLNVASQIRIVECLFCNEQEAPRDVIPAEPQSQFTVPEELQTGIQTQEPSSQSSSSSSSEQNSSLNSEASSSASVTRKVDLQVLAKDSSLISLQQGQLFKAVFVITNLGPDMADNLIVLTSQSKAEYFDLASGDSRCIVDPATPKMLRCDLGTLEKGKTTEITIAVKTDTMTCPSAIQQAVNLDTTNDDADRSNNTASLTANLSCK